MPRYYPLLFGHFSSRIWAVYCSRMKIGVIEV